MRSPVFLVTTGHPRLAPGLSRTTSRRLARAPRPPKSESAFSLRPPTLVRTCEGVPRRDPAGTGRENGNQDLHRLRSNTVVAVLPGLCCARTRTRCAERAGGAGRGGCLTARWGSAGPGPTRTGRSRKEGYERNIRPVNPNRRRRNDCSTDRGRKEPRERDSRDSFASDEFLLVP